MKKVIKTEKANLTEEEKSKQIVRSLKALYLATLIGFGSYAVVDSIHRQEESKYVIIEDYLLATIEVGDVLLDIAEPEIVNNEVVPPEGYTMHNGLCYRLYCEGEAPKGYTKAEDGQTLIMTDENNITPEGYIVVGDKVIGITDPVNSEQNGLKYFTLPHGYFLVGKKGISIMQYEKEITLTLKPR